MMRMIRNYVPAIGIEIFHEGRAIGPISVAALALSASLAIAEDRSPDVAPGLGAGDLISIQIYAEQGISNVLSGQFEIKKNGTINYPVLGDISAADMETGEFAELLKVALAEYVPITGAPAVSVVRYAPVFLLGHARQTGPIEFKPGMTVFDLILGVGGLPQPQMDESARFATMQEISDLLVLRHSLQVRLARLRAQTESGTFDGNFATDVPGADKILAGETAILEAIRHAEASQASDYQTQIERYDQEIASLNQTIVLHDGELKLLEEETAGIQKLTDSGLASKARLSDLKREMAGMQRQALEFRTSLYRVEQERLSLGERFSQAKLTREIENLELLRDAGVELTRAELKLKAARDQLLTLEDRPEAAKSPFLQEVSYTVIRRKDGSTQASPADTSTALQRGDIIRVDLAATSQASSAEADGESNDIAVARTAAGLP